jgi:group II intron reverse transcriptase/maturase
MTIQTDTVSEGQPVSAIIKEQGLWDKRSFGAKVSSIGGDNQCTALTVINKCTYKQLISVENLVQGLARTKNTAGVHGELKADITFKRIAKLHAELAKQTYNPSPAKRIPIPKPEGGVRFLGLASQIDKVVQGALLQQLEPLVEPVFLDSSYGFRPGRGCHDALKTIKYKWKAVVWVIKIDIKACFDKINHPLLLNKLGEFCDQASIELVRKLLKAGYVDIHNLNSRSPHLACKVGQKEYSTEGIPQGSLISPLLCNLYLHELDSFVEQQLCPNYNRGKSRSKDPKYAKRYNKTDLDNQVLAEYPELKEALRRSVRIRPQTLSTLSSVG